MSSCRATNAKELGALGLALRLARRAGLWRGDPAELLPVLPDGDYKPRSRWLSVEEVQRLLAELVPDRAARVAFIVATSARWGESDRATRDDVDLGRSLVRVRGTKTAAAARVVPVVLAEQRALLELALRQGEGTAALFAPWPNVRRDIRAACERAKIAPCSPNDLRRTFAHWLRAVGLAPALVAPAMGHVDSRMVERVYGRLEGAELGAAMRRAAVAHLQQPPRSRRHRADSADAEKAQIAAISVPRDGIEPSTRGFSIPAVLFPSGRKDTHNRRRGGSGVAHLQQRKRRA